MAIFITGDTHGDFIRFKKKIFYEQAELTKDDCVMIVGDFGDIWDGSAEDRHWLGWLEAKPFTTLFVSGNHENFDMLAEFPIEDWHGGRVQRVRPSVIHLMRGQIYDIQGRTFFTMGGASSHDIQDGILEPDDPLFKKKCRRLDARGAMYRVNHRLNDPTQSEQIVVSCLDQVGSFFACSPCISRVTGFFDSRCHVSLTKSKQYKIKVQNV